MGRPIEHDERGTDRFHSWTTLGIIRCFAVKGIGPHADSCGWLTTFGHLYEPDIDKLLRTRDFRLGPQAGVTSALDDRWIEGVSTARLDWLADPTRIDHELKRRGLEHVP